MRFVMTKKITHGHLVIGWLTKFSEFVIKKVQGCCRWWTFGCGQFCGTLNWERNQVGIQFFMYFLPLVKNNK